MPSQPTISVGVPVHNGGPELERAVRSFLGSDRDDLEVVISDNASTDDTPDVASSLAAQDPRVRHERTSTLLPVIQNFNRALELTRGRWFHWGCHDDWVAPDFFTATLDAATEETSAVATTVETMDPTGRTLDVTQPHMPGSDHPSAARRFHAVLWHLPGGSVVAHGLISRDMLLRIGGLRSINGASVVLAAELALAGRIATTSETRSFRQLGPTQQQRNHWVWLDPKNRGTRPLTSPRLLAAHVDATRSLRPAPRAALAVDAFTALVVRRGAAKVDVLRGRLTGAEPRLTH